jgi:hypothetical protein
MLDATQTQELRRRAALEVQAIEAGIVARRVVPAICDSIVYTTHALAEFMAGAVDATGGIDDFLLMWDLSDLWENA